MTGYMNPDGSELVGGQLPSGQGQALQMDAQGNLKTTATLSAAANQRVNTQAGDIAAGSAVAGAFVDGAIATIGTEADAAWGLAGSATVIALLKKLDLLLQNVAYDNSNELKASLYGKAVAAGDTPLLLDSLGQMTVEQFIQYQIMLGHGFSVTTGLLTTGAAAAFICLQLAANNSGKRVLIYSINIGNGSGAQTDGRLYLANAATADANLSALTAYNLQPRSANSSALSTIAGSPANTTQTSGFQGNQAMTWSLPANTSYEVLQNGRFIYFAGADTASCEVAQKIGTSGNTASITICWIEF